MWGHIRTWSRDRPFRNGLVHDANLARVYSAAPGNKPPPPIVEIFAGELCCIARQPADQVANLARGPGAFVDLKPSVIVVVIRVEEECVCAPFVQAQHLIPLHQVLQPLKGGVDSSSLDKHRGEVGGVDGGKEEYCEDPTTLYYPHQPRVGKDLMFACH